MPPGGSALVGSGRSQSIRATREGMARDPRSLAAGCFPRVRRVISRICALNLASAFGAMRRSLPSFAMLNPREFTLLRSRHRAFRLVDIQLQLVGQEPA